MGLFLHTALLPRCGEAEARRAVDACAELSVGLVPEACRYQEFAAGTAVWCNEGCSGYVHVALGNNETDNQDFILHIDMMFKDPTIELDGKVIFDHGKVVFD